MWKCKKCGCEEFVRTEYLEVSVFYKNENGNLIRTSQEISTQFYVPKESKLRCVECGNVKIQKNQEFIDLVI